MVLMLALFVLAGCKSDYRPSPHGKMRAGMFVEARDLVESQVVGDREDRRYMLDRMRAGVLSLDAGDPVRAERWFSEVYDVLRTQGINDDKTVRSVVLTEGVKLWKGEPFEQALALVYYGFTQAQLGSWDNARAAANNALFYLRDFDPEEQDKPERRIDTAEIARRAAEYEARQRGEEPAFASGDEYLDKGYVAEENNFTLAYLLHGIASQQLGRADEASDYYLRVVRLNPQMRPLVDRLRSGEYNTIVLVADGLGPRKIATGPGNALSRYQPLDKAREPAELLINGQPVDALPAVTNVNQMALDHRWNNLEDIRIAKDLLGNVALVGGAVVLAKGIDDEDITTAAVGAGILAVGALLKATAQANTDYCDVFPQRFFVAALNISKPGTTVAMTMPGFPPIGAELINLDPPRGPEAAFHYLRTPTRRDLAPISFSEPTPIDEGRLP